jgi:UDP-N-acetylglucosamine 4-epimerase
VINVAAAGRISLKQLFEAVRREVGSTLAPIYSDPRAGDVRDSQADISKARRLLGYTPAVGFDEGLRLTVAWYRESMMAGRHARA